jgi:toxin-antitoxin system PIN domain toxin
VSYSIDANLLLYAVNRDSAVHSAARRFIEQCAERDDALCLTWSTINAFLRLSTDSRVAHKPLSPRDAREWIDELINLPQTRLLSEEPGFWKLYVEVAGPLNPRGAMVTDTHLATLLLQHGVRVLYTRDRDFRKFDFLKAVDPLGDVGG